MSKGYGPSRSSSQSRPAGAWRSRCSRLGRSGGVQYVIGTPEGDRSSVIVNSPIAAVTRYDDAGSSSRHLVTVTPPRSRRESSSPFATPTIGVGAVIVKSYSALSDGWSLTAYQE